MIAVTLSCLFALASVAVFLSLSNSVVRAFDAYRDLRTQYALLKARRLPQVALVALSQSPASTVMCCTPRPVRPFVLPRPCAFAV